LCCRGARGSAEVCCLCSGFSNGGTRRRVGCLSTGRCRRPRAIEECVAHLYRSRYRPAGGCRTAAEGPGDGGEGEEGDWASCIPAGWREMRRGRWWAVTTGGKTAGVQTDMGWRRVRLSVVLRIGEAERCAPVPGACRGRGSVGKLRPVPGPAAERGYCCWRCREEEEWPMSERGRASASRRRLQSAAEQQSSSSISRRAGC
jgi:hypothetical protein